MAFDYDLAIIGSGGAAFAAAIEASRLGSRVTLIERGTVGGTCVNIGCVPSKTLLAGAAAYHTAASHPFAGLGFPPDRRGSLIGVEASRSSALWCHLIRERVSTAI